MMIQPTTNNHLPMAPVKPFNRQTVNLRVLGNYENRLSSLICQPIMTYELPTTNYQLNTSDERRIFMQNEPNFPKSQMNVTKALTKEYEKKTLGEHGKNEPKTNPIKANSKPIKANKMPNQSQFPKRPKMNVTSLLTKGYEQRTMNNELINTNPIKLNFKGKKCCSAIDG
jgi:hypothetical protein